MRATKATPGRALRFERGRPIAEFSVGSRGVWRASAPGVGARHVWVSFDGQCLVLRRDNGREPVVVDGRLLPLTPQRIVRLPCRVELGEARLVIDDQVPPLAVLDASAIERAAAIRAEVERAKTQPSPAEAAAFTRGRPDVWVPARREQILADGHATSVMPLEVLIQRGLAAAEHARQPHGSRRRTRKPHRESPRRSPMSAVAGWPPRLQRWLVALAQKGKLALARKGRVAPVRPRLLVMALLAPLLPLLCQVLAPSSAASPGESVPFEDRAATGTNAKTIAVAGTKDVAPEANDPAPGTGAAPAASGSAVSPSLDIEAGDGPQVRPIDEAAPPPGMRTPPPTPRTKADATSRPTSERLAVDALAAGDRERARALYVLLGSHARDNAAFAEAARILAMERNASGASRADVGVEVDSDPKAERLADGLATRAR